jgi:uncharacterized protein (DUF736 family)
MAMSNIGYVKLNDRGIFIGRIDTAVLSLVIAFRSIQSDNPRAPKYAVVTKNPSGQWPEIGAVWAQVAKETGEEFLQGSISDPSFATLYFAAFRQDDGSYALVWRPATRRTELFGTDETMGAARAATAREVGEGDGLGESTAHHEAGLDLGGASQMGDAASKAMTDNAVQAGLNPPFALEAKSPRRKGAEQSSALVEA